METQLPSTNVQGTESATTQVNQQPGQPGGLTTEDVKRMIAEGLEQSRRSIQSTTDKTEARITAKLDELRAQLGTLTPQQEQAIRSQIQTDTPPSANIQQGADSGTDNPVYNSAFKIMSKAGIGIETTDPEFRLLDHSLADENHANFDPAAFLAQTKDAIAKKKARLSSKADPQYRTHSTAASLPAYTAGMSPADKISAGLKQRTNK